MTIGFGSVCKTSYQFYEEQHKEGGQVCLEKLNMKKKIGFKATLALLSALKNRKASSPESREASSSTHCKPVENQHFSSQNSVWKG